MLKRARHYSANFDRYVRIDGHKIKEIKQGVKRQLRRRVGNEYLFRLQIKRPRPGVFEVGDQVSSPGPGVFEVGGQVSDPKHCVNEVNNQVSIFFEFNLQIMRCQQSAGSNLQGQRHPLIGIMRKHV